MVQPAHLAIGQEIHNETTKHCATAQTVPQLRRRGFSYASQCAIRPLFAYRG
ncbi:hypothetical protein DPMN_107380 [Dreissena polymorpha]|uniref:Uncharacterized protein n=1 Tax=Dreissena polymorpha TaxID=45954 RepID=A0A9D4QKZ7_DREPO|nr:hypothetical protein DPMN_107380 [Dreissena polymorpha]